MTAPDSLPSQQETLTEEQLVPPAPAPEVEPVNQPSKTPDQIRSEMVAEFNEFKDQLLSYHAYAHRIASLSVQYHEQRLLEAFGIPIENLVLLDTFHVADSPKKLDAKLANLLQIPNLKIKKIAFDHLKACFYLYV